VSSVGAASDSAAPTVEQQGRLVIAAPTKWSLQGRLVIEPPLQISPNYRGGSGYQPPLQCPFVGAVVTSCPCCSTVGAAESPAVPTDGARINSSHSLLSPRDTLFYKKKVGRPLAPPKNCSTKGGVFYLKSFGGEALKGKKMLLQLFI